MGTATYRCPSVGGGAASEQFAELCDVDQFGDRGEAA